MSPTITTAAPKRWQDVAQARPTGPAPAAHVDIAVRGARQSRVDVLADTRVAFLTVAAAAARDIERNADDVPLLEELHVPAKLHDLAGDLVAEREPGGCGGPAAHHVLVGATDVRRDNLEDHSVLKLAVVLVGQLEARVRQVLDLDISRTQVDDSSVRIRHGCSSTSSCW